MGNIEWKKCKILGKLVGTEENINRRKVSVIGAYRTIQSIFRSKKISTRIKSRTFNAYVASVFLYNSELWTLAEKLESTIRVFQCGKKTDMARTSSEIEF